MKLVEILARELKQWPEGGCNYIAQDCDGDLGSYRYKPKLVNDDKKDHVWHHYGHIMNICNLSCVADDACTAIVTRVDWEADRARIAKPAKNSNKDGWIRHRGGKCPVEAGVLVDVRYRDGDVLHCQIFDISDNSLWTHNGVSGDIMAYRLHKPADHPAIELPEGYGEVITATLDSIDGPYEWRDRIREIETTVEALEEERASLVQRLEDEGFRLIERVNAGLADAMQAHESSWPEEAPSIDSAPDWATHIGRDKCGYHWFDHKPEKYDSDVFVKGLLGLNGYREGRHKKAKDMENNLELWSCKI